MIADIDILTMKKLQLKTGGLLMYEGERTFELYYANKGPIILRTVVIKDDNALAFLTSLGPTTRILTPLTDDNNKIVLEQLKKRLEEINVAIRLKR